MSDLHRLSAAELLARAVVDDLALLHHEGGIGVLEDAHVLLDDDDSDAVVVDPVDDREDGLGERR